MPNKDKPLQDKAEKTPQVLDRLEVYTTPWVQLIEKHIEFGPPLGKQKYYALKQADYVSAVAQTPSGKILIVRQYRPAVETFTLEIPAGLVDKGKTPEQICVQEIKEETGHEVESVTPLGSYYPDTGRFMNLQHVFYAKVSEKPLSTSLEPGISVQYYTLDEIHELIKSQLFRHQLHISALLLVEMFLLNEKV